jgi:hypothetical protein
VSVSSMERVLDVAVEDSYTADCSVLRYGPPHEKITIAADTPSHGEYREGRTILRWYIGLMGAVHGGALPRRRRIGAVKEPAS